LGKHLTLTTSDGHKLGAYRADPQGKPKGGMVVIQEIFGVNHHIRAVCDRLANEGYVAVAPAMFDRFKPNFESGYTRTRSPRRARWSATSITTRR
jgi:carboxymethylenebutenolidase